MKLDSISNQVYVVAINEAKLQAHEYITPEHFVYAALMFDKGKEIIRESGGNVAGILSDLASFFSNYMPRVEASPVESAGLINLFEMATSHANSSGKQIITIGDLLAVTFNLRESFAVFILRKNGVDKLSLLRYISHGMQEKKENMGNNGDIISKYTVDLTQKAKNGELDPLIGRGDVMSRTVQVLCRRLKNNPIHVGDPGVGKTAVVEGLAQRIVDCDVPELLRDANVFSVDMSAVVAGTKYRGDFEERLMKILDALSEMPCPIVYLDEIHNIVGAGAVSGGGMDAGSILKPYLARGDIRFIGSTTYEEYKKYFEKDRALTRRFQKIDVPEPDIEESVLILMGLRERYERHHDVVYHDGVIRLICELTSKYIRDKFLPDKAIDVMDETGAFIRMSGGGRGHVITSADIEKTVALIARAPENTVSGSEADKLLRLAEHLKKEIFGQDEAVDAVTDAIKLSRSGLTEMEKPVANLLFVGPTGVGKTEIAKQLAHHLGVSLVRFDMSEYQEKHTVSRLIGSPPGYVGYEEGGILTESIRKSPHCVLLLDEIEKAHPDILNVLLQIMDYGVLTDNVGKKADFRNVIIVMTSNAGAREMGKRIIGFDEKRAGGTAIDQEVQRVFSPEFRNRLDSIVVFRQIDEGMAHKIAAKAVDKLSDTLKKKNVELKISREAVRYIAGKGLSEDYGAREIIRVVDGELKKLLADEVLFGRLRNGGIARVGVKDGVLTLRTENTRTGGIASGGIA